MGKYSIVLAARARKELQAHHKSGNQGLIKRIEQIFLELSDTPFAGTGNLEALKYHLTGYWSRRLNKKDRIVYRVIEESVQILIVSAIGHYDAK
jgi:toxin YoeB